MNCLVFPELLLSRATPPATTTSWPENPCPDSCEPSRDEIR